jgi:hypothetical protein
VRVRPRFERASTFTFRGRHYRYFYAYGTWDNERTIEIPLALELLRSATADTRVLEVGNVLTHYAAEDLPPNYTVVDKYEEADGVINIDVLSIGGVFDLIISISTLEHVGLDEHPREWRKARDAATHLASLLAPGGKMFATWALDYNRDLDDALLDSSLGASSIGYLVRRTPSNKWTESSSSEAQGRGYGETIGFGWPYRAGNALVVAEWFAPGGPDETGGSG